MDLFLKRPDAKEVKVNWLQDIGPIYPFDTHMPHVLLHGPKTKNDCEYICLFCNNKTEAIAIINHIIDLNGGTDKFFKHEQEKNVSHRFSGHLFNIGYRNKLSQQNHVIVELNRREERKVVSFNDNSVILYGIHKDSKKINSIIKGLNSIVYNSGEMTSGGGHLYFDSSGSHIVSYWSDLEKAVKKFKSIVDCYPENAINKDFINDDQEIKDFSYKNLLKILNKGNFIIEFKTDGFKINLSQGNSSFQMNFYIDEDGTAFNQDKNNWDTSNLTEKTFYENGNLMNEVEVDESGQANGITKKYHENGQLRNKTYWTKNIQEDGEVITYHTDGSKARKITVLNGEINGEFFEWHQNGNIKTQGTYNNGICHIEKEFDENGVLFDFKSLKFNDEKLEFAFNHWIENPKTAEAKYGHISGWDTSEVNDITDVYFKAKSLNIDVTNWSLSFEENGLLFKQINQKNFTAYHKNGKKRFEYLDIDLSEKYHWLDTVIDSNSNSKLLAYDENGIELKEFTVFLIPKKGDCMVVFKTDKSNFKSFEHFSDTNFLLDEISYRNHAINLTGDDEIDLKKYPPIILDGSHSQSLLDELMQWMPDKKFVMVYRWNRLHEDNCDYEDYLSEFETGVFSEDDSFDSFEDYSREINYTREEVAVLGHFDKIFITGKKSDSEEPGQEITKFPGSATREFIYGLDRFNYDELRIFEEEIFNNLNVKIDNEMMDVEGQKFPIAKKLILDVDKYKKPKFI
jgi:antitoxin component YwqK of YwqJK toxin-antitoxin module